MRWEALSVANAHCCDDQVGRAFKVPWTLLGVLVCRKVLVVAATATELIAAPCAAALGAEDTELAPMTPKDPRASHTARTPRGIANFSIFSCFHSSLSLTLLLYLRVFSWLVAHAGAVAHRPLLLPSSSARWRSLAYCRCCGDDRASQANAQTNARPTSKRVCVLSRLLLCAKY